MDNPKVSVIVPIFNVEKFLPRCLDTLINQTLNEIEIILVNDESPDDSQQIIDDYAKKDHRIIPIMKTNGGLSDARNKGIEVASGEYLAFIDSDDYIELDMLEKMFNNAILLKSDIVVCDMEYVYDEKESSFSSGGAFNLIDTNKDYSYIDINNSACNKIYKRKLFDDIEFPLGLWYEDLAIIPILFFKSKLISKVNEPLYKYYQRDGSIAHTINNKVFDIYKAIENISKYIDNNISNNEEIKKKVNSLYVRHGAYLTTLRIKDSSDSKTALRFLRENANILKKYYPKWYLDSSINDYTLKQKVVLKLVQYDLFKILLFILK